MISAEEARRIADDVIAAMPQTEPLRLADDVIERPDHWVFLFNSSASFESGDDDDSLAGTVPIAIAKDSGAVTWLNASRRIEDQLP